MPNDGDDTNIPRKRRKGIEKENLTPSPGNSSPSNEERSGSCSQPFDSSTPKRSRTCYSQKLAPTFEAAHTSSLNLETPGEIISVRLENFMCHANFIFTFGDKVNFISGKNGSGKSAILTALVVGLGGRTSATNRGTSITNLIKTGESKGSIEITLSNRGALSYRPDLYGDKIVVVRVINGKATRYQLLSEKGKLISKSSTDLQKVLMYFNIQVNNPVAILNQDTARTFLKSATPKELYSLFLKGTLIDEIQGKIMAWRERKLPRIKMLIQRKKEAYDETMKDLNEYSSKVQEYLNLVNYNKDLVTVERSIYWLELAEREEKLDTTIQEKARVEQKIDDLRENLESREGSTTSLQEKLRLLESELNVAKSNYDAIDVSNLELVQKVAYHKGRVNHSLSEMKKIQKRIDNELRRCNELQVEIDNFQAKSSTIEKERAEILQRRSELNTRSRDLKAVISTIEEHKQKLLDTVEQAERAVGYEDNFVHKLAASIKHKREYLQSLNSKKDELRIFSDWMPELVSEIEQAHKRRAFNEKPRGPLGRYIKLKEQKWGPAVENFLGNNLTSFVVSNKKDLDVMRKIFDRLNIPSHARPKVSVTQFSNRVYDCSSTEVHHPNYSNLFRSLQISDPVISNLLLDLTQPDTVLLIPTAEETYPLVDGTGQTPKNLRFVINADGTKFYPYPNFKCYSGRVAANTRFLQVSTEQVIRITEEEIQSLTENIDNHKQKRSAASATLGEHRSRLTDSLKELKTLQSQLAACENKLYELEQKEIPESIEVNVLSEDLQYRQKLLEGHKSNMEKLGKTKEDASKICESLKQENMEAEEKRTVVKHRMEQIQKEITEINSAIRKSNNNQDYLKELLRTDMAHKERYLQKIEKLTAELNTSRAIAEQMGPKPTTFAETRQQLEETYNKLNHTIKVMKKRVGSEPPKPKDYEARKLKYEKAQQSLKIELEVEQSLIKSANTLSNQMNLVLNLVCSSTANHFRKVISKRNYLGELKFDHEKKLLNLNIKPDPNVQANTALSTLSGGERSYSMVAFIMSLWKNMASPFYFLDEFDVFMDEVNRNLIMDLLMSHAKANPSKQFVFLTPHATNERSSRDVHFFRMDDPRDNL